MKKIFSVLMVVFFATALLSTTAWGQQSYTWNQTVTASWATGTNWTPTRTTPATDDILVFDGSTVPSPWVTGVPTQTIGKLVVQNNAYVRLQSTGAITLTINGGAGTDLDIQSGSTLREDSVNAVTISLATTATGNIAGTFIASNATNTAPNPAHRLLAVDASSITVSSGGSVEQGIASGTNWHSGNLFGSTGTANIITFQNGATFIQRAGSNPFGLTQPSSRVVFNSGSTFKFYLSGTPSLTGRTFGDFIVGNGAASSFATNNLSADCIIYNVTQESGAQLSWGTNGAAPAAGTLRIRGNVTVQGTLAFKIANRGGSGIIFESGGSSTIGGAGTGSVSFAQTISVASGTTITLAHNVVDSTSWTVNGQMDLGSSVLSGGGSYTVASGATLKSGHASGINGNLTNSGGTSLNAGANYEFNGAIAQVTGALLPVTVNNLTINNTNGVTLSQPTTVNGALTLTSGNITTTNANLLTLGSSATVSGGSSSSFVNGPMAHTIASTSLATRTFNIGKGTAYRPVTLAVTQGAATSTTYTAEVLNSAPLANTIPGTLGPTISTVRYWSIVGNPITAITSSTVEITYDTDDGVTDNANLRIAQGPSAGGGAWVNLGGAGTANTTGTITSTNALTDFTTNTVYTLANTTIGANVLPVELQSFSAKSNRGSVELAWSTATEVNNMGFEIEKNVDGSWNKIAFVEGYGTTNTQHAYSYVDANVFGKMQYRLKQIDRDGKFTYSKEVEAVVGLTPADYKLNQNYPNPFNPSTTIRFAIKMAGHVTLRVYNTAGQEVRSLFEEMAEADRMYSVVFDGTGLASGTYFYVLQTPASREVKKMLMLK